jgi:hypothetical protein
MVTIPPEAQKYLKHLPTIAKWVKSNKQISSIEMKIFKFAFREPYDLLKQSSYEEIRRIITPYQNDPQYGCYVKIALSPKGEKWLRYALDLICRS